MATACRPVNPLQLLVDQRRHVVALTCNPTYTLHTTNSQLGVSTNVNWQQPSQAATYTGSSTVPNVHTRRHARTHTRLMALFRDCTKCNSLDITVPTVILPYTIYVPINVLTNIRRLQLCVHCASAGWRHRATLAYEQIWRHLEVHNVSLRRQRRTKPRP